LYSFAAYFVFRLSILLLMIMIISGVLQNKFCICNVIFSGCKYEYILLENMPFLWKMLCLFVKDEYALGN
jgi:hypothetical protein